jgi:uncharacterized Fe-S cluster-containing radical SAM superfamily protein
MYDPLELSRQTAKIVCRGTARKYYRFRPARFYGGIATADCLGCNLRCAFCWAWEQLHQVQKLGQFYEAKDVAERLAAIARKKGFYQVRLSGNEPTLGMTHLTVYAHLMKPTNQEAACRLENSIFGVTGHKMVTKSKKGLRSKTATP